MRYRIRLWAAALFLGHALTGATIHAEPLAQAQRLQLAANSLDELRGQVDKSVQQMNKETGHSGKPPPVPTREERMEQFKDEPRTFLADCETSSKQVGFRTQNDCKCMAQELGPMRQQMGPYANLDALIIKIQAAGLCRNPSGIRDAEYKQCTRSAFRLDPNISVPEYCACLADEYASQYQEPSRAGKLISHQDREVMHMKATQACKNRFGLR